tara:strand:- start:632 stop:2377 length:1746 start_codon:yes stop_codon:yes gene_type:complete
MQAGSQLADGRYTLEQCLKRTGMAEVWLASQHGGGGFSKKVVIKMIHPDLNEKSEARQRFLDEARVASHIHHNHVVQIYDFGEQDRLLYLAMEFIDGYDVEGIITKALALQQSIPLPFVCRLIADACQGLGFIHEMADEQGRPLDLVHRDISPQNLMVSKSGALKIIDFGIVKARQKRSRTRTGVVVGKLQYMSPEQLSSEELDRRADIYSLGLVLFEMLTLQPRFRGNNMLEVFYEAFNEPPPPIVDLRPDCPQALVDCVHKALAKEKEERFSNAYEMQEVLESILFQLKAAVSPRQIATFLKVHFETPEPSLTNDATVVSPLGYRQGDTAENAHSEVELQVQYHAEEDWSGLDGSLDTDEHTKVHPGPRRPPPPPTHQEIAQVTGQSPYAAIPPAMQRTRQEHPDETVVGPAPQGEHSRDNHNALYTDLSYGDDSFDDIPAPPTIAQQAAYPDRAVKPQPPPFTKNKRKKSPPPIPKTPPPFPVIERKASPPPFSKDTKTSPPPFSKDTKTSPPLPVKKMPQAPPQPVASAPLLAPPTIESSLASNAPVDTLSGRTSLLIGLGIGALMAMLFLLYILTQ